MPEASGLGGGLGVRKNPLDAHDGLVEGILGGVEVARLHGVEAEAHVVEHRVPLALLQETFYRISFRPEAPSRTRYLVAFCGGEAYFDTSAAERELGFKPEVPIREGLASALEWWSRTTNHGSG